MRTSRRHRVYENGKTRFFQVAFIYLFILISPIVGQKNIEKLTTSYYGNFFGQKAPSCQPVEFVAELFSSRGHYGFILHSGIIFTQDGEEAYFTVQDTINFSKTIMVTKQSDNGWDPPKNAGFSITSSDDMGWISPDGQRIYFFSQVAESIDILNVTQRNGEGWSEPVAIESIEDLHWNDGSFFISAEFSDEGGQDVYYVDYKNGSYQMPFPIGLPINTQSDECFQCFSDSKGFMIFYRYDVKKENRGLFLSNKNQNGWDTPINLCKRLGLPSGFRASLSPNEEYVFILNRKDGIYWIRSNCLKEL